MKLLDNGKECTTEEWVNSPERVLRYLNMPRTASEVNQMRWGSYVPVSVDTEDLRACRRRGLVTYDKRTKKWAAANARVICPQGSERKHDER